MRRPVRWIPLLGSLAVVAPLAVAQSPVGTGVQLSGGQDQAWDVSVNGGAFAPAFLVTSPPGAWHPNVVGDHQWISATASGTGSGPVYTFRTMFDLTGFDPATASLSIQCWQDNTDFGLRLNGSLPIFPCLIYSFPTGFTTVITNGVGPGMNFVAGVNTLTIEVHGDGTTDGLLVDVIGFNAQRLGSVPEPTTVALTAGGLLALAGVARRRRAR